MSHTEHKMAAFYQTWEHKGLLFIATYFFPLGFSYLKDVYPKCKIILSMMKFLKKDPKTGGSLLAGPLRSGRFQQWLRRKMYHIFYNSFLLFTVLWAKFTFELTDVFEAGAFKDDSDSHLQDN